MVRTIHLRRARIRDLVSALLLIFACQAIEASRLSAQTPAAGPVGVVDFRVGCAAAVQVGFDRAVALLHHMTYPQARTAFESVAAADPGCAMAHWGIAMTLFQPLWPTRPGPEALRRGWEEVQRAQALGPRTERERLLLAATTAFFTDPESPDYWARIHRWEREMAHAFAAIPDDNEVAAFYALAHLATAPATGAARAHADRAAEILLDVRSRLPGHPGAMHYLVHANDTPGRERDTLGIAGGYERVAPRNPHALHMPTHIYTRLGDWVGVIRGNRLAAEAALDHPAGPRGDLVWDEFPHAIEYLVYAYLQLGADDSAATQVARLRATARLEPTFKTAFHLASTEARLALERRDWRAAAAIEPRRPETLPWDRFAWPEGIAVFARGLGAAHQGGTTEAASAVRRLEALEAGATAGGEELFARNLRVLRLELSGRLAQAEGRSAEAVGFLMEAVALEGATPKHAVTPGPTLPALELLGDLLMEQARPSEALAAYQRSQSAYPNRFNSLLGAARAARALGDETAARTFYLELQPRARSGQRREVAAEIETYLAR